MAVGGETWQLEMPLMEILTEGLPSKALTTPPEPLVTASAEEVLSNPDVWPKPTRAGTLVPGPAAETPAQVPPLISRPLCQRQALILRTALVQLSKRLGVVNRHLAHLGLDPLCSGEVSELMTEFDL